jgi:hypothetical protein
MTTPAWKVSGQYYETCSCDFICPCLTGQMAVTPTHGTCTFAMAYRVDDGRFGDVPLDGLGFIVLGHTPGAMNQGDWSVGVIVDERASAAQRDSIATIVSGAAGGPMAALSGLLGKFLGVETAPIGFTREGVTWSVNAGRLLDMAAEGAMGIDPNATAPMHLDNTGHPAANRLALAHAKRSHVHAFGMDWDDTSGRNNGQYAPFAWQGG